MAITAHCIVKNEEYFIRYAILSVIDFVDSLIIFDTGSTDATTEIIREIIKKYPQKIIFEEKGVCDKKQHTVLRQEMIDRTTTEWFMILDGDEVWTQRAMREAIEVIRENKKIDCLIAPFYLCVGDVFHTYRKNGSIEMLGKKDFFYPRFIRICRGVHWSGDYNSDMLIYANGSEVFQKESTAILHHKYWHMTHLKRSPTDDEEYSSYGTRKEKRRETYCIIGTKIKEPVPEVFGVQNGPTQLSSLKSCLNFLLLIFKRLVR